jgi:hypothetical protein
MQKQADLPWHEKSKSMKILTVVGMLAFGIAIPCLFIVGGTEQMSSTVADSVYRHPHLIKGKIRFFTDRQEFLYSIARPVMGPAFLTFIPTSLAYYWLLRRKAA